MEPIAKIGDLDAIIEEVQVIGIDEGQFYPDLLEKCLEYFSLELFILVDTCRKTRS